MPEGERSKYVEKLLGKLADQIKSGKCKVVGAGPSFETKPERIVCRLVRVSRLILRRLAKTFVDKVGR